MNDLELTDLNLDDEDKFANDEEIYEMLAQARSAAEAKGLKKFDISCF